MLSLCINMHIVMFNTNRTAQFYHFVVGIGGGETAGEPGGGGGRGRGGCGILDKLMASCTKIRY
jgi:hypothetical protein